MLIHTRRYLAMTINDQGRHVESQSMFEKVLERKTIVGGADHPSTLLTHSKLGRGLMSFKRFDESLAMLKIVLKKQERICGEDNDATLETMEAMSLAQVGLGRFDDSERTASRGLLLA
jgi:hypothetical protein